MDGRTSALREIPHFGEIVKTIVSRYKGQADSLTAIVPAPGRAGAPPSVAAVLVSVRRMLSPLLSMVLQFLGAFVLFDEVRQQLPIQVRF